MLQGRGPLKGRSYLDEAALFSVELVETEARHASQIHERSCRTLVMREAVHGSKGRRLRHEAQGDELQEIHLLCLQYAGFKENETSIGEHMQEMRVCCD